MTAAVFSGVGVALVTLFDADGELDAPATAAHAARLVDDGVAAVLVAGTTGEAATLERQERIELVVAVLDAVGDRVPVLAGTGAASARQAARLTADAVDAGATAVLALSPPGAEDCRPYYQAVAAAAEGKPVLAYHYPAVSGPGIPVDVLSELPVAGCKDSSGDATRLMAERDEMPVGLYTGSTALVHTAAAIGCSGAILALANLDPVGCLRAWAGDGDVQRELVSGFRHMHGIGGLKRVLWESRGTSPSHRVA